MSQDGTRYVVTKYPELMVNFGTITPNDEDSGPAILHDPSQPGTSSHPNTQLNPPLHELFSDMYCDTKGKEKEGESKAKVEEVLKREISATKVFQDDPIKEVFHDTEGTYYATTMDPIIELPMTHLVIVERLNFEYKLGWIGNC